MDKIKRIFSGVQPSGNLTIGNYIGAISQWRDIQAKYECVFSIVDYHAITVKHDSEELRKRIVEVAKIYLAAGIDPDKSIIFQQSAITAHTELAWVLSCAGAYMSDLNKMTQYKDKSEKIKEAVSVGLFTYPVLMAADILLYDTQSVPVGDDQKQHVELARDIAKRFNTQFGSTFIVPEVTIRKEGARIMSLLDPSKKMSKSDENPNSYIALLDDIDTAKKKIMKAVTDSGSDIDYDPINRPAIANLLTIYAQLGNRQIKRLVKDYQGKGYGEFKRDLAEVVAKFLTEFQEKYKQISDEQVKKILSDGTVRAKEIAEAKMETVRKVIGVR
jgi:tryptophanyl-tRNA synthetase